MSRIRGKTTTMRPIFYAGIDVSKAQLELAASDAGAHRFSNDAPGIAALIACLRRAAAGRPCRAAFEPTGRMHLALWRALDEAGLGPVPVAPYRARRFAEADGRLAKTDALDAAMLARAAEALDLAERPAPSEEALRIKELKTLRDGVTDMLAAAKNRLRAAEDPLAIGLIEAQIVFWEGQKADLDRALDQAISADPETARRREIITSIPGFAEVSATTLLVGMPELGALGPKRAGALIGAAPMMRQSGAWTGRARPRGGRRNLAVRLHMAALAAARANPDMARFRRRLRAAGKPPKVILRAILRKLVILADALIRDNRTWRCKNP